jgi:hypothetical protein
MPPRERMRDPAERCAVTTVMFQRFGGGRRGRGRGLEEKPAVYTYSLTRCGTCVVSILKEQ